MKAAMVALSIALMFAGTSFAQDLTSLSASDAAAKIRKGEITSEALTKALIEKAKAGKSLNVFITFDEAGALKAAKAADAAAEAKEMERPVARRAAGCQRQHPCSGPAQHCRHPGDEGIRAQRARSGGEEVGRRGSDRAGQDEHA